MCVSGSGVGGCVCWGQRLRAIWQTERSPPDPPTSREGIQAWFPLVPQSCQGKWGEGQTKGRDRWALILPFTLSSPEPSWTD